MNGIVKKKYLVYIMLLLLLFFDMKEVLVNIHCILNIIILIFRQESNTTFLFESSYRSSIPSER